MESSDKNRHRESLELDKSIKGLCVITSTNSCTQTTCTNTTTSVGSTISMSNLSITSNSSPPAISWSDTSPLVPSHLSTLHASHSTGQYIDKSLLSSCSSLLPIPHTSPPLYSSSALQSSSSALHSSPELYIKVLQHSTTGQASAPSYEPFLQHCKFSLSCYESNLGITIYFIVILLYLLYSILIY